jgi:hypothetical protein
MRVSGFGVGREPGFWDAGDVVSSSVCGGFGGDASPCSRGASDKMVAPYNAAATFSPFRTRLSHLKQHPLCPAGPTGVEPRVSPRPSAPPQGGDIARQASGPCIRGRGWFKPSPLWGGFGRGLVSSAIVLPSGRGEGCRPSATSLFKREVRGRLRAGAAAFGTGWRENPGEHRRSVVGNGGATGEKPTEQEGEIAWWRRRVRICC